MKPVVIAGLVAIAIAVAISTVSPVDNDRDMVLVKAGPALLGANDRNSLSGPAVYQVDAFLIDRHEVTNLDYSKFVKSTSAKPPKFAKDDAFNHPGQPVTGITWDEASRYCKWRGKRLPSEVEWEKAARAGDARLYPWGNDFNAKFAQISGDAPLEISAYPQQDKSPNGLVGMAGGVSEWVNDVQIASGGVCGRAVSNQPGFVSNDKSMFEKLLSGGGELGTFAPACAVDRQRVSPAVTAHNIRLSRALARLGKPEWGMQKCAFIKGNSFNGEPHMTKLTNRMWDYTNSYAEFVGFRCAKSADNK